jgi:hypothetical protein
MNFGDALLANLAATARGGTTVLRKRVQRDESSSSSSSSSRKRARLDGSTNNNGDGLPPGLGLDLGLDPPSQDEDEDEGEGARQHSQQRREDHLGAGGNVTDEAAYFVPLDQASKKARKAYIKRLIDEEDQEHTCFFCDFVKRYDQEKRRVGGQKEIMLEGSYAYKFAIEFFQQNPNLSEVKKARGLLDIYKVHVYDRAVSALGGRKPAYLPEPKLEDFLEHIVVFNYDQVSLTKKALDTAQNLVDTFNSQIVAEGKANEKNARTVLMANQQFHSLTKEMARLREARGIPEGPFVMDPQKVMAFADTRPIEPFRKDSEGLGIGGATATNTTADAQRVTARRPNFGNIAHDEDEEEEEDASDVED